jgi:hypothetical protein
LSNTSVFETRNTRLEPCRAPHIMRLLRELGMLAAVDLDDEALLQADEIDDVDPKRMLAAKAIATHLTFAQLTP